MNPIRSKFSAGLLRAASALLALPVSQTSWAQSAPPLIPMPRTVVIDSAVLPIGGSFATTVRGCSDSSVPAALSRFARDLGRLTGTQLTGVQTRLTVACRAHDTNLLTIEAKEAYRLDVTREGVAIDADGETGVLRALATLRQLIIGSGPAGPGIRLAQIDDAPRFRWRGIMVDTARHFMTVETLKRQIDAMELAKLNVLHLHLADNEGFRIESRRFPELTAALRGEFYTQKQIGDLVRYAGERGVRIVPEIDMPGHSLAVVTAYPELAAVPLAADDPLIKPKGALNPASEKTYRFLRVLLGEIAPLFPDQQFHVGGDEVSDSAWKDSAEIEAFKNRHGLATKQELEAHFHARVRAILARFGKTTVGWDEMIDGPQTKELIVQSWRSSNPVSTATAKGHRVIVSAGYYLDQLRPADVLYAIDPMDPVAFTTMTAQVLERVRRNPVTAAMVSEGLVAKPLPPLTPEQEKLVLGGEAPLWAELVSDEMLDGRLWPRALALAERFWSPATLRDPDDMYGRLLPAMDQMRALGLLDNARRDWMVARLAPEAPEVVRTLVDITAPVRMYAHTRTMLAGPGQKPQELIEPADAASTDGSPARRFRLGVTRYLAGDKTQAANLRRALAAWRDNEAAFVQVATGRPLLESAIPSARDAAALGVLGLAALDNIEHGRHLAAEQTAAGRVLLKKLADFEAASKDLTAASVMPQPPAHLIMLVAPDVARLLDAAEGAVRQ